MNTSDKGQEFIRSWEKCSLTVYPDLAGNPTVGFGHLVRHGEDFSSGITPQQADDLFAADVRIIEDHITPIITVSLSQNQFDACLSLAFNIGPQAFSQSTLLHLLNSGDMARAADQFTRWCHSAGVVSQGLLNRRLAEQGIFLTGTYINHT